MTRRRLPVWRPSDDQMECRPAVSGNSINGVGEKVRRRPSPIYWHPPEQIPHGPLQKWFYERTRGQYANEKARCGSVAEEKRVQHEITIGGVRGDG